MILGASLGAFECVALVMTLVEITSASLGVCECFALEMILVMLDAYWKKQITNSMLKIWVVLSMKDQLSLHRESGLPLS